MVVIARQWSNEAISPCSRHPCLPAGRFGETKTDWYSGVMRIRVKVIAGASRDHIEKVGELEYKAWVRVVPEDGKANKAVLKILAKELGVPVTRVRLVSGASSGLKMVEVHPD